LIVGSPSYGKGTIQRVFPLDTTASDQTINSPNGFVKITIGKFYRLDGHTAQWHGVKPDVYLPDAFDALEIREKFEINSLPADTAKQNNYYKPLQPLPGKELELASNQRISASAGFKEVKQTIQKYADFFKNKSEIIPLKVEAFEKWRTAHEFSNKEKQNENLVAAPLFTVANHQYESQRLQSNAYAGEVNSIVIKNLQQDIYVEEAFRILSDFIQKTTPK
jgi:carboxyl-terminal processing protease